MILRRWLVLLLLCLLLGGWMALNSARSRAFERFHGGPYHSERSLLPPARVAQTTREREQAVAQLLRLQPGLGDVPPEYLGQPLEETQEYLLTLGGSALKNRDRRTWSLVVKLMTLIWLGERQAVHLDPERAIQLTKLEQRLRGLYAWPRISGPRQWPTSPKWPQFQPQDWESGRQLAHRLLINQRRSLWQAVEGRTWVPWWNCCQRFDQFDRWHGDLDAGRTLGAGPAELESLRQLLEQLWRRG